jgi:hypothetical protein
MFEACGSVLRAKYGSWLAICLRPVAQFSEQNTEVGWLYSYVWGLWLSSQSKIRKLAGYRLRPVAQFSEQNSEVGWLYVWGLWLSSESKIRKLAGYMFEACGSVLRAKYGSWLAIGWGLWLNSQSSKDVSVNPEVLRQLRADFLHRFPGRHLVSSLVEELSTEADKFCSLSAFPCSSIFHHFPTLRHATGLVTQHIIATSFFTFWTFFSADTWLVIIIIITAPWV